VIGSWWGEAWGKAIFFPPETGLQGALRSGEFTMRQYFSCFAFDCKTAVAAQMEYTSSLPRDVLVQLK